MGNAPLLEQLAIWVPLTAVVAPRVRRWAIRHGVWM